MAQLHVFNDTEKLGEIQKVEKLAKYNDKYLFSHKVMMGNSLIIVISLAISLNYLSQDVNCRLGVGVKDNLANKEMSSLVRGKGR